MSELASNKNYEADTGYRNRRLLAILALVVAGMVGLAFASVPLYRLFCQVTGFGGTTQVADAAPLQAATGLLPVSVRFDANVSPALKWEFIPVSAPINLVPGEQATILYRAKNIGTAPSTGTATFNVTPQKAGPYFMKIECFCFTEQTLLPGESMEMPVSFFVDSEIGTNTNTIDVDEIVLSYTFFEART